ncbi:MAG: glycosyltransferase family 2 protein [Planctomycetales bacterium]|nr:glycosyltransferase family 2 protein [Planctomycetales bacterium]
MQLLIVLVNYHGADLTIDCLRSLQDELQAIPGARLGICENGSGGDQFERIEQAVVDLGLQDRTDLIEVAPNRGFTGGNNAVIRPALASDNPPDAILLLNNDTLVRPGAIVELTNFLAMHPEVGVCGSRLEYPDGQTQLAARRILGVASEFESYARFGPITRLLSKWITSPPEVDRPHPCGWIPGAALMVRREVWEKVGLLDEDLYTYFDDVDYCLRAARAGWETWYVPTSRIVHLVGKTTGVTTEGQRPKRRPDYWFWARRHYFLKNFGPWYAAAADVAAALGLTLFRLRCWLTRKTNPDPPHLLGDLVAHSVLRTGFRLRPVENPALAERARS